jgi:hypothetical protein
MAGSTTRTDEEAKRRNKLAILSLLLGKVAGIAGIVLAFSPYRTVGGALLVLAFVLVSTAVGLTLTSFRKRKLEEDSSVAILEKMVRDGTLKQHLRDVEEKLRAERDSATRDIEANTDAS